MVSYRDERAGLPTHRARFLKCAQVFPEFGGTRETLIVHKILPNQLIEIADAVKGGGVAARKEEFVP